MKLIDKNRRTVIKGIAAGTLLSPWLILQGCDVDNSADTEDENSGGDTGEGGSSEAWASGDTSLITVDNPEDAVFSDSSACQVSLIQPTTEGPCYFGVDQRDDISSGISGLPIQLCLRLIDANCDPLVGWELDVWHCDVRGVYSGDTSNSNDSSRFASGFCTGGDTAAESSTWYRGALTTDASGRVNFKTHFPGWYSGRTLHIHFSVDNGVDHVISQLCYPDAFAADICTTHGLYSARGEQDTPLAGGRDTVFGSDYEDNLLTTERNSDGSLLAYATIQVNPSS